VVDGKRVSFVITDSGKPFDPTAKEEVNIHTEMAERPIGGLGIHLVRTIMDTVSYERKGENNILTITKNY
jgi:sigma-B regulation protein RsbU (phosphoserine phosphatase)